MFGKIWIFPAMVILLQSAQFRCQSCASGQYSHNGRCSPCQQNCARCMWSNMCKSCKNGYFLFGSKCRLCPPNCLSCSLTSRSTCDACKVGYHGIGCTISCSQGCHNRHCYKADGHCRYGCLKGYYGDRCSRCPGICRTCSSSTSCTSCKFGFYGSKCNWPCRNCRYNTCLMNGQCLGCMDGYHQGTTGCILCPGNCSKCSSNSVCDECKAGYFGTKCDQPCRNCRNNICSINGHCSYGCIDGFYQDTTTCTVCPENCSTCESASVCHACEPGYYGTSCQYKCPGTCYKCGGGGVIKTCDGNCSACIDGCSKDTGECFRCIDGYHKTGGQCQRCRSGCAACSDSNNCTTCRHGYGFLPETADCVKDSPSVTASSRLSVILGTTLGVVLLALAVLIIWIIMRRGFCKQTVQPHANQPLRYRGRHASNKVHGAESCHDDALDTDVGCIATIEANTDNVYSEIDIESVHSSRQSEDLECGGDGSGRDGLRRAEPGGDGLEMINLYDETFTFQRPTMHAAAAVRGDGADTYSHIRHVSLSRQHRRHDDDDSTYDHVTVASRLHQGDVDDTYDIVNGSNVKLN